MRRSRPVNATLTPTLVVSAMAAFMLAGCGGSGGSSGSLAAATTVVTGTTAPTATVTVGTTTGAVTVTSGSTGAVTASVETSQLNTSTAVVVTVTKPGFETCTTTLTGLSTTGGTVNLAGCTTLTALGTGSFAPSSGAVLTRLGDGVARTGDTNAKLTLTAASATNATIELGSPADPAIPDATFATYTKFTVSMNIRGLEAAAIDCPNSKITVFQATSATATPTVSKVWTTAGPNFLVASPSNGDFRTDSFELSLATDKITKTGGKLFVKLESGACTSNDPFDDFEFVNVLGKFSS